MIKQFINAAICPPISRSLTVRFTESRKDDGVV